MYSSCFWRHRRIEARFHEAEAQHPLGVEERLSPTARAEHDHHELLAAPPRGHGQVVAGLVGEAGLERLHPERVVEERNVPRIDPAAVDEGLPAQERAGRRVVVEQPCDQLRHVLRVRPLERIGQAMGVREAGGRHPELLALRIHAVHEARLVTGQMLGERGGGVVGGGDGHALEQDTERDVLPGAKAHAIAAHPRGVRADRDHVLDVGPTTLDGLERQVERHELHQAGRGALHVGVLLEDGPPVGVQEQDRLGIEPRRADGLSTGVRDEQQSQHHQSERRDAKHRGYFTR